MCSQVYVLYLLRAWDHFHRQRETRLVEDPQMHLLQIESRGQEEHGREQEGQGQYKLSFTFSRIRRRPIANRVFGLNKGLKNVDGVVVVGARRRLFGGGAAAAVVSTDDPGSDRHCVSRRASAELEEINHPEVLRVQGLYLNHSS